MNVLQSGRIDEENKGQICLEFLFDWLDLLRILLDLAFIWLARYD